MNNKKILVILVVLILITITGYVWYRIQTKQKLPFIVPTCDIREGINPCPEGFKCDPIPLPDAPAGMNIALPPIGYCVKK